MIFLWIINERMKDKGCKSHDGHLSCHHIIMSERDGWDRRCSQIKCQRLTHHGPCECQLFSLNSWINEYRTWLEFFKQSRSFASHFTAQVCATKCSLWLLEHRTDLFMYCMLFQTPPPARELWAFGCGHLIWGWAWHHTKLRPNTASKISGGQFDNTECVMAWRWFTAALTKTLGMTTCGRRVQEKLAAGEWRQRVGHL